MMSLLIAAAERALRAVAARSGSPPRGTATADDLRALATGWYEAWNAHDLDGVLGHYAESVIFSSPFIAALGADRSGTLVGKPALRSYWTRALKRFPDLHFEPRAAFFGASSIALQYRAVDGLHAAEVMEIGPGGLIIRAAAHYDRLP